MPSLLSERYERYKALLKDKGYLETEQILNDIIAELESIYGQAYDELHAEALDYLRWFEAEENKKRKLVESGELSIDDYKRWRNTYYLIGQRNYAYLDVMAQNLANTSEIADSIINGYMPQVYATNLNYTSYEIEKNTHIAVSFAIYDEQTIERLIRKKPDLLPKSEVDIPREKQWDKTKINSAITQGILQGETVEEIADRIAAVSDMNCSQAIRNAKTMTTSAQNGGRLDGLNRALDMGIALKKSWIATLDGHTRASHRALDGEVQKVKDEFSNGLMFPGDASGEPREVYNCRCTMISVFDDTDTSINSRNTDRIDDWNITYDEWKSANTSDSFFKAARNENRDMKMYKEYKSLLKDKAPATFKEFQQTKYNNKAEWNKTVSAARTARSEKRKK